MYESRVTNLSKMHLKELSEGIDDDIYLLGGWAVHYVVNENFKVTRGREYIGSRDIDIGFHFEEQWEKDVLKTCNFVSCIDQLIDLGFQWQGFRLYKDFDFETLKPLTKKESDSRSYYDILKMYVDPIVDTVHKDFTEICGYNPIDEPLLKSGFSNNWFIQHSEFDNIKVTQPHLLLAMKMNSVLNRDKDDKRIKDISDIFALMWHSIISFDDIKTRFRMIYDKNKASRIISKFDSADINKVSDTLGIDGSEIEIVFRDFSN